MGKEEAISFSIISRYTVGREIFMTEIFLLWGTVHATCSLPIRYHCGLTVIGKNFRLTVMTKWGCKEPLRLQYWSSYISLYIVILVYFEHIITMEVNGIIRIGPCMVIIQMAWSTSGVELHIEHSALPRAVWAPHHFCSKQTAWSPSPIVTYAPALHTVVVKLNTMQEDNWLL